MEAVSATVVSLGYHRLLRRLLPVGRTGQDFMTWPNPERSSTTATPRALHVSGISFDYATPQESRRRKLISIELKIWMHNNRYRAAHAESGPPCNGTFLFRSLQGRFVSGHDFSRAERDRKTERALAPARFEPI